MNLELGLRIQRAELRVAVFLAALLMSVPAEATTQPLTGIARNIDGDSLYVGVTEVRLFGIDAPEYHQVCTRNGQPWDCGVDAASALARLVQGKAVRCSTVDHDDYSRTVAQCTVGNIDVNRTMVALGYAVAYRHYSNAYVSAEESARASRRGLWAAKFEMPSMYRRDERAELQPRQSRRAATAPSYRRLTVVSSNACVIKGNRGPHGWIYHLPGMPYYEQTRAEQMFCSERDAQVAGYRRARVR